MYPIKSLLRFKDTHTAVITNDQRLYQVKSPSNEKVFFNTVESWLASLPDSPTVDSIVVTSHEEEMQRKNSIEKPVEKRFNVPKKYVDSESVLFWGRHIYYAIKQFAPQLLKNEAVMNAYNAFVGAMTRESATRFYIPMGKYRFLRGVNLDDYKDGIPIQVTVLNIEREPPSVIQERKKAILLKYNAAYRPLYDLIKRAIIPKIEQLLLERRTKMIVDHNDRLLMNIIAKQTKIREKYEQRMKQDDRLIQYYRDEIEAEQIKTRRVFPWEDDVAVASVAPVL